MLVARRLDGDGGGHTYDTTGCEKLDLADTALHDAGALDLSRVLHGDVVISDLYLTNTGVTSQGAKHIADVLEHTRLRSLYLWKNAIGDEGVRHVAQAVARNPRSQLEVLYLGYTGLTVEGAKDVAAMLKGGSKLKRLDLRSNSIGDEGAEAIANALRNNTQLQEVFLWDNGIGALGMMHLANALRHNTNVHTFHVHGNEGEASHHYGAIQTALRGNQERARREAAGALGQGLGQEDPGAAGAGTLVATATAGAGAAHVLTQGLSEIYNGLASAFV